MREDVEAMCAECHLFGQAKSPNYQFKTPLQPMVGEFSNEIVGVDLIGPLPQTLPDNNYILVIVDYFAKWTTLISIAQGYAKSVAQ